MGRKIAFFNTHGKYEVTLQRGFYNFECWGASGGSLELNSSSGAYVSGNIFIHSTQKLYLFVGEKGIPRGTATTFNGGGAAAYTYGLTNDAKDSYSSSGGGSTDIRLIDGNWDDINSLKSRIIVASGGGGETNYIKITVSPAVGNPVRGGNGGTLVGESSSYSQCYQCTNKAYTKAGGGEQQNGGNAGGSSGGFGNQGSFGRGADSNIVSDWPSSGGGSGYFGGGSGGISTDCLGTGAGGSSFVSGCNGCSAVTEDYSLSNQKFSGNVHYSGYVFSNIVMKSGDIVNRSKKDGQIKISLILSNFCTSCHSHERLMVFSFVILLLNKTTDER